MEELTENWESCDHPEEECITSHADAWGMFTIYCKKCNTTFSRYDYPYIIEQRKKKRQTREVSVK
jgi:hypothetical protein